LLADQLTERGTNTLREVIEVAGHGDVVAVELLNRSGNLVGRMLAGAAHPHPTTGDYLNQYMAHQPSQSADLGCSRPHRAILRLFDRTVRALPGPGTALLSPVRPAVQVMAMI
jgi:hypothetical protein